MFVGGSAGSTAGGLKVSRIIILGKSSMLSAHKMLSPRSVKTVRLEGKTLSEESIHTTQRYFALYMCIFVISIILVSIDSNFGGANGLMTNISAVATCINNVGPAFSGVGPMNNFADLGILTKIVLSIDMLIGRLEIMPILLIFYPKAWRTV
jgi:trk system potassium uptake protein TrkH